MQNPVVYILNNDQAMIESLSWLIESTNLTVKPYKCLQKFLAHYDPNQHGCILLDVRMLEISGMQLHKILQDHGSNLPVIFISGFADVSYAVQAMKEGAIDFLLKPVNDKTLIDSINRALFIDKNYRDKQQEDQKYKEKIASLSLRESQVLQGILASQQNKIISVKLNISLKTVEAHRASLMKKLNVNSVVELIKLVVSKSP